MDVKEQLNNLVLPDDDDEDVLCLDLLEGDHHLDLLDTDHLESDGRTATGV